MSNVCFLAGKRPGADGRFTTQSRPLWVKANGPDLQAHTAERLHRTLMVAFPLM